MRYKRIGRPSKTNSEKSPTLGSSTSNCARSVSVSFCPVVTMALQYPACSTCQKAKKWLTENNIEYTNRLIVDDNPTVEELKAWIPLSGLPVKKFFNTSGVVYKELKLSSKLPTMTEEEQIALLATNGKLEKRPLVVTERFVLVGFKPEEWEKLK